MPVRTQRLRESSAPRRAAVIVWIIVSLPVVAVAMVLLIDVARIWLGRIELKNALDAAALSAVKTWGEGGSTSQARLDANDAFGANTILGNTYALTTTSGTCTNGNDSDSDGNVDEEQILLGSATDGGTFYAFNCNGTPNCIQGAFTVIFAVDTSRPCLTDPLTADTFTRPSSFRVESFSGTTGMTLDTLTVNLATMTIRRNDNTIVADDGFFDFRTPPPATDLQVGFHPPTVYDNDGVAPPATAATLVATACGSGIATTGVTTAAFDGTAGSTPTSLTWTFTGFDPGDVFTFGSDTDNVGPQGGTGDGPTTGTSVADFGGDFGSSLLAVPRTESGATVTVVISGQTFSGILTRASGNRSAVAISGNLTANNLFAARIRRTVPISSVTTSLFGLSWGPYDVTADAFARYNCTGGVPQLFVDDTFVCTCP